MGGHRHAAPRDVPGGEREGSGAGTAPVPVPVVELSLFRGVLELRFRDWGYLRCADGELLRGADMVDRYRRF